LQPTFTWSAPLVNQQMGRVRYRLEIAADPAFTQIIYTDTTDGSSLTLKRPLRPAATRWWRVVGEAFPDVQRVSRVAAPFSVPDWVTLLNFDAPGNTTTDSVRPTFRWTSLAAPPPSGPLVYDVQIINAQTGQTIFSANGLTTTTLTPTNPLTPNIAYRWRVIARSTAAVGGVADTVQSQGVFLVTSDSNPPATLLYQNFPNYFPRTDLGETSTHIWFDVNETTVVELAIYDLRGRLIRQLIPARPDCGAVTLEPGIYGRTPAADTCITTDWDGRDANGNALPRGVYILRMKAAGSEQIKKILYLPN
jgi:hypothetical protein